MELREFVAETLKQVVDGIAGAQAYTSQKGATVNPKGMALGINRELIVTPSRG